MFERTRALVHVKHDAVDLSAERTRAERARALARGVGLAFLALALATFASLALAAPLNASIGLALLALVGAFVAGRARHAAAVESRAYRAARRRARRGA